MNERVEDLEHELKVAKEVSKKDHQMSQDHIHDVEAKLRAEQERAEKLQQDLQREKQESEERIKDLEEKMKSKVCTIS
ncbi:hypothetical protein TeGR_g5633 [Tetraparma gracilis]|uniref:Uncharacterized protein n=1 Tax=Tetraparma gracilis TaxID=2962635 RepID=A0ABQ6N7D5_9STRA|nr:hypothetical protein TeGR_g5633 [Tetraparma gracilis]